MPVLRPRDLRTNPRALIRYAGTWPTAIDLVTAGRVDLDRLVTGTYDLADAALALTASRRDDTAIKAVVRPGR